MVYESRTLAYRRKPKLILDRNFKQFDSFEVGEQGQALLKGTITGERKEPAEDGVEYLIKTIEVSSVEIINNKNAKNYI